MSWITDRFKHISNIFKSRNKFDAVANTTNIGMASYTNPDRVRFRLYNEKTIVAPVYNRIAMDVSSVNIRHIRQDEQERFTETINSTLERCLSLEPNTDQTARQFFQSLVMSMFENGVVAVVPTDCSRNPQYYESYDIYQLRLGEITEWWPEYVRVKLYNDTTGQHEEVVLPKRTVGIIENPFYSIMNESGSILQRLIHKMALLDIVDERSGSNKFDLIIQLPYLLNSDRKREQAERRRKEIEDQLAESKYGIAYIDGTEHITQLNRSVENDLVKQVEYLTNLFYNQLGMTKEVFEGTADEKTMLNYNNRTIVPILETITQEFKRKFLSRTAQAQNQSIEFFNDPFKLTPAEQFAEIVDKLTRNEILSSNEVRSIIGYRPIDDPRADELRNKNIAASKDEQTAGEEEMFSLSQPIPVESGGENVY